MVEQRLEITTLPVFVRFHANKSKIKNKNPSIWGINYYGVSMDVGYHFLRTLLLIINAFEANSLLLVQCALEHVSTCPVAEKQCKLKNVLTTTLPTVRLSG